MGLNLHRFQRKGGFGAWAMVVLMTVSGCSQARDLPIPTNPVVEYEKCEDVVCLTERAVGIQKSGGIVAAIRFVENSTSNLDKGWATCHDVLHRVGLRAAGEEPVQLNSTTMVACSGGFFHGLFSGYGKTEGWLSGMVGSCKPFTDVDALMCKHGYGHGAAAGVDNIPDMLSRCEDLARADGGGSVEGVSLLELCGDGAFMEVVHLVDVGEWGRLDPLRTCQNLSGWGAWGCWRQMGRMLPPESVVDYAEACNGLDPYLAEGCAAGVAEASSSTGADGLTSCSVLVRGRDLCLDRLKGLGG